MFIRSFLIPVVLAVALGAAGMRIFSLTKQNAELSSENQDLDGQLQNLRSVLVKEHMKDQTEIFEAQSALEQIQEKVAQQNQKVSAAEQRLTQESNGGAGGKQIPALHEKISAENEIIADLNHRLGDVRARENALRNQDKYFQQQSGLTEKQSDNQLKAQIAEQQRLLKQMNDELKNFWRSTPIGPQYSEKYSELETRIRIQKNTIQQLNGQRSMNNAQWGYEKTSSHSQNQQEMSSLKSSEQELQAQLIRERNVLQALNQDLASGVQTEKSQEALIQTAEADFRNQKAKLQDLLSQQAQAADRLHALSPQPSATPAASQPP